MCTYVVKNYLIVQSFFSLLRHRCKSSDRSANSDHQCRHWLLSCYFLWIRDHLWLCSQFGNICPLAVPLTLPIGFPHDPHMFLPLWSHQVLLLVHLQPTHPWIKSLHLHQRIFMLNCSCIPTSDFASGSLRFKN